MAAPAAGPVPKAMPREDLNGDFVLPDVPNDYISSINMGLMDGVNVLVSGNWGKQTNIWMLGQDGTATYGGCMQHEAPVLCSDIDSVAKVVYAAGCDRVVRAWEVASGQTAIVGQHEAPIKVVRHLPEYNAVLTGSWDKTIKMWDLRAPNTVASMTPLADRVLAMDAREGYMAVAVGPRQIALYDMRNMAAHLKIHQSAHEQQTKSLVMLNQQRGYAYGSVEGRVQINYFGQLEKNSFPFRCHRVQLDALNSESYSVNGIYSHPTMGTLATVGADGTYVFWDHMSKNRIKPFLRIDNAISAGAFSADGTIFAYAASYDWSKGYNSELRNKPVQIMLHPALDQEVRPREQGGTVPQPDPVPYRPQPPVAAAPTGVYRR